MNTGLQQAMLEAPREPILERVGRLVRNMFGVRIIMVELERVDHPWCSVDDSIQDEALAALRRPGATVDELRRLLDEQLQFAAASPMVDLEGQPRRVAHRRSGAGGIHRAG